MSQLLFLVIVSEKKLLICHEIRMQTYTNKRKKLLKEMVLLPTTVVDLFLISKYNSSDINC